ncbi:MAG TPA: ABC transporter permease [Vicinamibacterales bacterium]|nr:ABC transporter permease [Vicinamibacterales bacterium]
MPRSQRRFGSNLSSLFGWRRPVEDVQDELELHAELRAEDLERRGMPRDAARTEVARRRADPAAVARICAADAGAGDRDSHRRQWLGELIFDLKYGFRMLRAQPGFAAVTLITIALGLGANTALFGVVNAIFFRPLPIDPEGRLVRVREYSLSPDGRRRQVDASRRSFDAVLAMTDQFERIVAFSGSSLNIAGPTGVERASVIRVSPGMTSLIGIAPAIGRTFSADEERAGDASGVLIISHRLWSRAFGRSADLAALDVTADGRRFAVVGVMPDGYHFPYNADAWTPATYDPDQRLLAIFARVKPGVDLPALNAKLEATGRRLNELYPQVLAGLGLNAVTAREAVSDNEGPLSVALMSSVGFLLLIGCANVAMLLTTRFAVRQREVVVRAALGCGRARQLRQFVTETVLLFLLGGAAGIVVAVWLKDALVALLPDTMPQQMGVTSVPLDWRVWVFGLTLSCLCGLAAGIVAAARASRSDFSVVMKSGGRSAASTASRRVLGGLVIAEIALALVLLTGASLMIRSVNRLLNRDLGLAASGLLTFQIELSHPKYRAGDARVALMDEAIGRIAALPGVSGVGATTVNPICCGDWGARISIEGQPAAQPSQPLATVHHRLVTPDFFTTMQIPLREGRTFTPADREGSQLALVVDARFARRFWPNESAIGKRVKRGGYDSPQPWLTIVGVVGAVDDSGEYTETWYLPYAQFPLSPSGDGAHVMVRAAVGDPLALVPSIRDAVLAADESLAMFEAATMTELKQRQVATDRVGATVIAALAGAGLLLAVVGVYGLLAFAVAQETRDIGVRVALGASGRAIVAHIATRALRLTAIGLGVGVAISIVAARLLRSLLVDVGTLDSAAIAVAASALALGAAAATVVPIRRALKLDPLMTLKA